jgi:hypothetical protein
LLSSYPCAQNCLLTRQLCGPDPSDLVLTSGYSLESRKSPPCLRPCGPPLSSSEGLLPCVATPGSYMRTNAPQTASSTEFPFLVNCLSIFPASCYAPAIRQDRHFRLTGRAWTSQTVLNAHTPFCGSVTPKSWMVFSII